MEINCLSQSRETKSIFEGIPKHIVAIAIAIAITYCFGWLVKNWNTGFVTEKVKISSHYLESNLFWIEPALAIVLIIIFHIITRLVRRSKKGGMAIASGMFFYSPNHDKGSIEKGEKFLREKSIECSPIYTMGATGWNTFSDKSSPLYTSLESCHEAQIILFSPISNNLEKRAQDVNQDANEYRNEICKSINYLTALRTKGVIPERIKLKVYNSYPGWKYIFIQPYVWVQYYSPNHHVKNTPVYMYENVPNGIYRHLLDQFLKRWNSHWLCPYNFDNKKIEFIDKDGKIYKQESIEQLLIDAIK